MGRKTQGRYGSETGIIAIKASVITTAGRSEIKNGVSGKQMTIMLKTGDTLLLLSQ